MYAVITLRDRACAEAYIHLLQASLARFDLNDEFGMRHLCEEGARCVRSNVCCARLGSHLRDPTQVRRSARQRPQHNKRDQATTTTKNSFNTTPTPTAQQQQQQRQRPHRAVAHKTPSTHQHVALGRVEGVVLQAARPLPQARPLALPRPPHANKGVVPSRLQLVHPQVAVAHVQEA